MSDADANSKLKASAQATTMGKLTLKSSGKKIKLSWKKGKGNTDNIVKYQVYRSTNKNFKKSLRTATTKKLTFTDSKKLMTGTKYYYKVRAQIKLNGKTYWSKWSSVKNVKCK